jgi:hypothetical protein
MGWVASSDWPLNGGLAASHWLQKRGQDWGKRGFLSRKVESLDLGSYLGSMGVWSCKRTVKPTKTFLARKFFSTYIYSIINSTFSTPVAPVSKTITPLLVIFGFTQGIFPPK